MRYLSINVSSRREIAGHTNELVGGRYFCLNGNKGIHKKAVNLSVVSVFCIILCSHFYVPDSALLGILKVLLGARILLSIGWGRA